MEKERYIVIENFGRYIIHDNQCDKYYSLLGKDNSQNLKKLLNQQDARIKELEEALKKANTNNYLTDYYLVEKENQQLKQQLSDEEKVHDLCIDYFNEECEKLRKQIKFESEARERFKQKNQQLKQSQNQRAIDKLEKIKNYFDDSDDDKYNESEGWIITNRNVVEYVNNQIKELEGDKK